MKNKIIRLLLICTFAHLHICTSAQNVGIGATTPESKLHIKGSADTTQLIIDANSTQSNTNPLIKLRNNSGADLLWIHSDHPYNTFTGLNAGRVNNAVGGGTYNTFIGSRAGYFNTIGYGNTANGFGALYSNGTAGQNVAIGNYALYTQSYNPGYAWASDNVAVGYQALYSNQPASTGNGIENTALGNFALRTNTVGFSNTASGYAALYSNTIGRLNTANGQGALYSNTIGNFNTANGYGALSSNTTASQNTAIGNYALSTQSYNPGSAWNSGNVAVGFEALYLNQPTSTGTGISNTAVGNAALRANTIGFDNAAIGSAALWSNTTGSSNTANGYAALYSNTIGNFNTANGQGALYFNVGGHHNIAIGYGCGTASGSPNVTNTISIGNDNILNAASNQAFIGNTSTTFIGGQVTWSTYSDARVKNKVREDVKGLDFITRLRPVTYYRSIKAMTGITGNKETEEYPGKSGNKETEDYPEKYDIEKIKFSGFLAQDVEIAAKEAGYDFSGITIPKKPTELYALRYAEFVVPLVKAVQEQQQMIEQLKQMVLLQQKEIEKLKKKVGE